MVTDTILTVTIKPGYKAGTKIRFANEGDEMPGNGFQDIEFVVEAKNHPVFTREGDNLRSSVSVNLVEALTGFSRSIKHLDGSDVLVTTDKPVQPQSTIFVPGRGMPISKLPGKKGDLIVTVNVSLPTSISASQANALKQIFPS